MTGEGPAVVTFGETMGLVRVGGRVRLGGPSVLTVGGAESNVATGLSRLGHLVRWVGRIGDDEVGQLVLRTIRAEGIDTARVVIDPERRTGLMVVEKRVADISRVAYYRAGSAGSALSTADLEGVFDDSTRVLHVTGISPALSASAAEATSWAVDRAVDRGIAVSLDVNYRAGLWGREDASAVLTSLASRATVVFASDDELALVAAGHTESEAVRLLLGAGVREVIVKRGGDGASAWHGDTEVSVPARPVTVVETIGAGDAFTAGYLSALLDGLDVRARLERGATAGAFAVSAAGDWEPLPTRAELELLDRGDGVTIR